MPLPLYAQSFGHGAALIVLHGLFGSGTNWCSLARGLSDGCTVHLLDLRNHGRSPHADSMNYPEMANDLRAYMDGQPLLRTKAKRKVKPGPGRGARVRMDRLR